jgi:hypothetical protein
MYAAEANKTHQIKLVVEIEAEMTQELQDFINSIPTKTDLNISYEEWSKNCINTLNHLEKLIENGKVYNSFFTVSDKVDGVEQEHAIKE